MSIVAPHPMLNYFGYLFDGANWHLTGDSSIPAAPRRARRLHRWPPC